MRVPSQPTLIRRMLEARLKKLTPQGPTLAATLSLVEKTCGQPSCACRNGGPKHTAHHLSFKQDGRTRTVYVPVDLLDEVRKWVSEHQRLKRLQAEVSQLSLALVTTHVATRKRKKGRP
jgi:hypothetical protein